MACSGSLWRLQAFQYYKLRRNRAKEPKLWIVPALAWRIKHGIASSWPILSSRAPGPLELEDEMSAHKGSLESTSFRGRVETVYE
ncbi:unnamed protein product [Fusarium venenatum]|uniref:Uncharacterized protein n=1 Tax=Fusarium venenatum TaxID=56646 RepID=A0A2L2T4P6_9HYPO|nr:uncharacterized protein FVRRES_02276 [Fusarium venenatum]CEI65764.1 unnamed protein product [Fusarium venenatum]